VVGQQLAAGTAGSTPLANTMDGQLLPRLRHSGGAGTAAAAAAAALVAATSAAGVQTLVEAPAAAATGSQHAVTADSAAQCRNPHFGLLDSPQVCAVLFNLYSCTICLLHGGFYSASTVKCC
jgi:hypothetical protein